MAGEASSATPPMVALLISSARTGWSKTKYSGDGVSCVEAVIQRAVQRRINDNVARGGKMPERLPDIEALLDGILEDLKSDIAGQFIARRVKERRTRRAGIDPATLSSEAFAEFEALWRTREQRLRTVPGKRLFAALNEALQKEADVAITTASVIEAMAPDEVPPEVINLIQKLDDFRSTY